MILICRKDDLKMHKFISKKEIEKLKLKFPIGKRIMLDYMDDPYANNMPAGLEGTILAIDDAGTIHVNWDNGSNLGVIYKVDKFHLM